MFSSFKLPLLARSRKNSNASECKKDTNTQAKEAANSGGFTCANLGRRLSKTPMGTPLTKRHHRRASDVGTCPAVASLRPGSVAFNSDQLQPGDVIHSINGISTTRLRNDQITTLLNNVEERAHLEIEYNAPTFTSQNSLCITTKVTTVTVERVDGSLGITLRGGQHEDPTYSRPLIITNVRINGPAHRTGLIKVGDRLLSVDNQSLTSKTLLEAQRLLAPSSPCLSGISKTKTHRTLLTIEYDVSIMESVKYASGPLLIEIERSPNEDLGLVLNKFCDENEKGVIYVESIRPASVADRCGALHVGDQLYAVDDFRVENTMASPAEVMCILQSAACNGRTTQLEILPAHAVKDTSSGVWMCNAHKNNLVPNSPSLSGFSTINSRRSRHPGRRLIRSRNLPQNNQRINDSDALSTNYCTSYNSQLGVCHAEVLTVILCAEGAGFGFSVDTEQISPDQNANIIITNIENDSVADRCGSLQVGDRIISVNGQSNLTLQEVNSLLECGYANDGLLTKLDVQIEFDVADSIVPSSGIFTVKLARQNCALGITITASKTNVDEPFVISEIRRGSVAHRIGTLRVGDRLLAIDNQSLDHTSLESALEILQSSPHDIVTLKIEKVESPRAVSLVPSTSSCIFSDHVVYTVELVRNGGPLGITISGSEDQREPIVLSRLIAGGLAEKTGALHVGDRILAINGESLLNRPLSTAIKLLQCSDDRVQLKISRRVKESRETYPSPGVQSLDSAVESWTGSTTYLDQNKVEDEKNNSETSNSSTLIDETKNTTEKMPTIPDDEDMDRKTDSILNLQYYSDTDEIFCPSPLPLPNYSFTNQSRQNFPTKTRFTETNVKMSSAIDSKIESEIFPGYGGSFDSNNPNCDLSKYDIYHVILYKDAVYDDYGFSVSDGLYEKGVFVNRIRKGGPADIVGLVRPYDRILQVNETKTLDFDCCLTVPLIASAGDRIELMIARKPGTESEISSWMNQQPNTMCSNYQSLSNSQSTITKTL